MAKKNVWFCKIKTPNFQGSRLVERFFLACQKVSFVDDKETGLCHYSSVNKISLSEVSEE
jgi:hypothetical protein